MPISLNDLTVNFSSIDGAELMEDWHWLVGTQRLPILVTALGDAFLQDTSDGTIHLLSVGAGTIEQIAATVEEFKALLDNRQFIVDNFVPKIVMELRALGEKLGPNQLYGYKVPPVLGGKYSTDNLEPTDIGVHFSILGQTCRQVQGVPDGTPIGKVEVS